MKERVGEAGEVEVGTNKKEMVFSFRAISESFLRFTENIAFPWKSWYIHWRLIAFQRWGAPCTRAVWCINKQWICLHISLIHWQKPGWLQQNCSLTHLAWKRSLTVTHQWSYGALCGTDQQAGRGTTSLLPMDSWEIQDSASQECRFLCMQVQHLPWMHLALKCIGLKLHVVSLETVLHLSSP